MPSKSLNIYVALGELINLLFLGLAVYGLIYQRSINWWPWWLL